MVDEHRTVAGGERDRSGAKKGPPYMYVREDRQLERAPSM
jgi:hypothetical protein